MDAPAKKPNQRPILKWAGGKFTLLPRILPLLPKESRLVEPFVGAGAVFINSQHKKYHLNDLNADLMSIYRELKKHGDTFIEEARQYFTPKNNDRDQFYNFRDRFNELAPCLEKAAIFIYLNRHGYNGLCRYNSSGEYNVPYGDGRKAYFPEKPLNAVYKKIKNAKLSCKPFEEIMEACDENCVVYCDPPYVPLSDSSKFTKYCSDDFGIEQQELLAEKAEELANRNVRVVISNHDTPITRKLYKNAKIESFEVPRYISCNSENRKPVMELLAVYN